MLGSATLKLVFNRNSVLSHELARKSQLMPYPFEGTVLLVVLYCLIATSHERNQANDYRLDFMDRESLFYIVVRCTPFLARNKLLREKVAV